MSSKNKSKRRSSMIDREYRSVVETPGRYEDEPGPSRHHRTVERTYERRQREWTSNPRRQDHGRYDLVEASTSSGRRHHTGSRHRAEGTRHHRGHSPSDYMYYAQPDRRHPHNNQYSARPYYGKRDPYTGRFVEASEPASSDSPPAKGFLGYLKEAFSGYGPDKSAEARAAYKKALKGTNRKYDDDDDDDDEEEPERRAYRDGFKDGMGRRGDRGEKDDRRDRRSRSKSREPGSRKNNGRDLPSTSRGSYADARDDVPMDEDYDDDAGPSTGRDRRVTAGGYGGERCCGSCAVAPKPERRCCPSDPPPCPAYGNRWETGPNYGRPRSCSLKAGGNGRRGGGSSPDYDDDDYYGWSGDRGRYGRGRPRSNSASPGSSGGSGNDRVRDRSAIRNRGNSSSSPDGNSSRRTVSRLERQRKGRNVYSPPSAMFDDSESSSDDEPVMLPNDGDDPDDEVKLPPFLDGKISPYEYGKLMPVPRLCRPASDDDLNHDTSFYHQRLVEFGDVPAWHDTYKKAPYERGNMYCSNPGGETAAWTNTAKQANAITLAVQRDSLRDSVMAANMHHSTAVLFLMDASMRIGAIRHMGSAGPVPKKNPLPEVFKKLPPGAAPLLEGGPTNPARGATASVLRGSYGALAYWGPLRMCQISALRSYQEYMLASTHKTQVYILARMCKAQTTLSDFDLDAMSECFAAGLVAASVLVQFLYLAVGYRLHPEIRAAAYEKLIDVEPYVKLPMGSDVLTRVESLCLGYLDTQGDVSIGVAGSVVGTHVAIRSALTEIMVEIAECNECPSFSIEEDGASVITVSAMMLQRLLGYLNVLACSLVIAALYHGRNVNVRVTAFELYKFLCETCGPLYRPVSVGEFDEDIENAMRDLGLQYARGDPPQNMGGSLTPINTSELSVLRIADTSDNEPLGPKVPLSQAIEGARDVLLGAEAMEKIRAGTSGARARGLPSRSKSIRN